MRTNYKMSGLLKDLQTHDIVLSPEASRILAAGFVEERGCVLLASEAHNSKHTPIADAFDETGYECFVNHLHLESLRDALELAKQLAQSLSERFKCGFAVIVGFDGREATVRFHKIRPGQSWLHDDLEKYQEAIAVLDGH